MPVQVDFHAAGYNYNNLEKAGMRVPPYCPSFASVWFILALGHARAQDPPSPGEQHRVLQTVAEFARGYLDRLPDFTCTRTTQHFLSKAATKDWQPEVKVAYELSYYGGAEHYRVVTVNDVPKKKVSIWTMAGGWIETNGNFGPIISELFDAKVQPDFQWYGWDDVHSRRAMVFSYSVGRADSSTTSTKCVDWIVFRSCKALTYGFHGRLYVDRESLDVLRVTNITDGLPSSYPQGNEQVDYGRVTVAGEQYLLPIADRAETTTGKTLFRNDSSYSDYHKFVANATVKTEIDPLPKNMPVKASVAPAKETAPPLQASQCFEARDGTAGAKTSRIARATVAAAFDERQKAEKELLAVTRETHDSDEAMLAHAELAGVLLRSGRVREALEHDRKAAASGPDGGSSKQALSLLEVLAKYPQQSVVASGYSRLPLVPQEEGIAIQANVNQKSSLFMIDTGAAISAVSELHAKSMGMTVHDDSFSIADIGGNQVPCHLGIAAELTTGKFRLRDVPFCVIARDRSGSAEAPDLEAGILGLPVLLAFGTVRWSRGGIFEIGFPSRRKNVLESNVCFEGGGVAVQAIMGQRKIAFDLDTGNSQSFLYSNVAEDFPDSTKGATGQDDYTVQGLGDEIELHASQTPEVNLKVAGQDSVLRDVLLLAEPLPSQCLGCYGNVGMDLLNQARIVTLDFGAMKLTLER